MESSQPSHGRVNGLAVRAHGRADAAGWRERRVVVVSPLAQRHARRRQYRAEPAQMASRGIAPGLGPGWRRVCGRAGDQCVRRQKRARSRRAGREMASRVSATRDASWAGCGSHEPGGDAGQRHEDDEREGLSGGNAGLARGRVDVAQRHRAARAVGQGASLKPSQLHRLGEKKKETPFDLPDISPRKWCSSIGRLPAARRCCSPRQRPRRPASYSARPSGPTTTRASATSASHPSSSRRQARKASSASGRCAHTHSLPTRLSTIRHAVSDSFTFF